jgi:hypothetical protein
MTLVDAFTINDRTVDPGGKNDAGGETLTVNIYGTAEHGNCRAGIKSDACVRANEGRIEANVGALDDVQAKE